jgi:hypothetical protein
MRGLVDFRLVLSPSYRPWQLESPADTLNDRIKGPASTSEEKGGQINSADVAQWQSNGFVREADLHVLQLPRLHVISSYMAVVRKVPRSNSLKFLPDLYWVRGEFSRFSTGSTGRKPLTMLPSLSPRCEWRFCMSRQYPQTLEEALGKPLKFPLATLKAVRAFAASNPWRGTLGNRWLKFQQLHADLCRIYGVEPALVLDGDGTGDSGNSSFQPHASVITIRGRLSVITFLHEWGHVLKGSSEFEACRWSLRLFQRCFPKSWSRLRFDGHMARSEHSGGI